MEVKVVLVLALAALASASIGDNTLDANDRRVYFEPVLAPPRDSKTHATDRSRQFPILILLSQQNPSAYARPEASAKSLKGSPIYVKTLEDQAKEEGRSNREKRHATPHKKSHGGGYGGGGGGGYGYGGGNQGHYPRQGGGCGGGCGGGSGGGQAVAVATANAYGKK